MSLHRRRVLHDLVCLKSIFATQPVELLTDIRTVSGEVFARGEVLVVAATHRGRFVLRDPDKPGRYIYRVERSDIALIVN